MGRLTNTALVAAFMCVAGGIWMGASRPHPESKPHKQYPHHTGNATVLKVPEGVHEAFNRTTYQRVRHGFDTLEVNVHIFGSPDFIVNDRYTGKKVDIGGEGWVSDMDASWPMVVKNNPGSFPNSR